MSDTTEKVRLRRSSIFDMPTNVLALLVYVLSAGLAWIPFYIGYVCAWALPFAVFLIEKNSSYVRFCAAQAFALGLIRIVIDIVFDSIEIIAQQTVVTYGQEPSFVAFWGNIENPGLGACIVGIMFSTALTVVAFYAAYKAYKRKLVKVPLIGSLAEYMTRELKPN